MYVLFSSLLTLVLADHIQVSAASTHAHLFFSDSLLCDIDIYAIKRDQA